MGDELKWSILSEKEPEVFYANLPVGHPERQRWIEAIKKWRTSFEYQEKCDKCGEVNSVYTQEDDCPEYYADVYIHCKKCNEKILFELPVN